MKFGISLSNRGPLATPQNLVRVAQRAEALGYDSAVVSDHILIPRQDTHNYPYHPEGRLDLSASFNYYEPIATLGFLAGCTQRIRLGISVLVVPYRNPMTTAKMLASIDALAGGRLFLGVGTGWWEDEFKALGRPQNFAERGPRTDEYIRIYRTLWNEADPEFKGRFFSFSELEFSPKPAQAGGLPIWVGGHTGRALRRAVELGDVWHPIGQRPPADLTPRELGVKRDQLRALAKQAGRDGDASPVAFRAPLTIQDAAGTPLRGPVGKICEDLRAYAQQGVGHLTIDCTAASIDGVLEQIEHVAAEIIPEFA